MIKRKNDKPRKPMNDRQRNIHTKRQTDRQTNSDESKKKKVALLDNKQGQTVDRSEVIGKK